MINRECSYYGRMDNIIPVRTFSDDLVKEAEIIMLQAMREMEERIKRHITESKREIIKQMNLLKTSTTKPTEKEKSNGSQG